jgi:hypothetical protein
MNHEDKLPCSVTELKGMFGRPVKTVSVDEMNLAIAAQGAAAVRSAPTNSEEVLAARDNEREGKRK